ncbi:MAG TPA: hypothetical protein PKD24_14985 [Pyrinomonadaceae bacterium]|nr:hypothetical protein [Pyrinomonadaceae bacterium]HMP66647.1 hypothetical protein [Pyrinomonadaceae bacterium]
MGYYTKASDWEVAGIGALAGGAGVAGGWFFFLFKSQNANVSLGCRFTGLGMGVGADLGKIGKSVKLLKDAPKLEKLFDVASYASVSPNISFEAIECDRAFSLDDLHRSPGRITMAGAAAIYGYTLMYITSATGIISANFASQPCNGWGAGFGASAMSTIGMWFNRA